jgi:uncharacterized protein with HEPN domain
MRAAAERAIKHIAGLTPEALADDPSRQDGVVRCLIILGEAAKNVSPETQRQLSGLDWSGMIGLRNIVVHRYQEIDYGLLWRIVNRDLQPLIDTVTAFLPEA